MDTLLTRYAWPKEAWSGTPPSGREIDQWLREKIGPSRYGHSQRVAQLAHDLAEKHGISQWRATLAGFLHDAARDLPKNHLLKQAQEFGIIVNEIEACQPILLHAEIGTQMVSSQLGLADPEVLGAIRLHTTGGAPMSRLAQLVYLADLIEPERSFPGVLALRGLAWEDLSRAVGRAFDMNLSYLVDRGRLIHPGLIRARNAWLRGELERWSEYGAHEA